MSVRAYIGVGANLGDPQATVAAALQALTALGRVTARSSFYRTQPWGKRDQPYFVNAVAALETDLAPRALLSALKRLERRFGRVPGERWGPRALDLDILTYGDLRIAEPDLCVPHPRLRERAFVLVPLAEIDPAWAAARDALGDDASVEALTPEGRVCDR